ncbi:type IX secretion system anionic LPS delivery protein PorZ [Sunxiuqinia indica]|uniref:type IX secretion system anionic LPS delivery protein PorZ n=1 Tax=Sunxiuqinia indica TaxID=2692584 RepID=UPI00135BA3D9|nr:two-component regulator propeller domain-containing protein [Sunxiuqinia indica]
MIRFNILCLFVLLSFGLSAQVGVGKWMGHLSYYSAQKVIVNGTKVYCISTGGLFIYDQADNSIRKLNQINGLSDVSPKAMAFGEQNSVVVLAYENSNLDLIYEDEIFNLSDIKRKQIQGDKNIYNVLVVGSTAYLSCGFGIVAVNLDKREIKDTYYIGENGSPVVVNAMTYDGESLYAATKEGIFKADANEPNLQNFNHWTRIETIPHAGEEFTQLGFLGNSVIACYYNASAGKHELYKGSGDNWTAYLTTIDQVLDMQVCDNQIVISQGGFVGIYDENEQLVEDVIDYNYPNRKVYDIVVAQGYYDKDGAVWLADKNEGLVKKTGGDYEQITPQGPIDNQVFSMTTNGADLWVTTGGRSDAWGNLDKAPQLQLFRDGSWSVFNRKTHDEFEAFEDIVNVVADPADPDHIFVGTWGFGVVEMQGREYVDRHDQFNSTLQTAIPEDSASAYVRIGGMAFDSENNLWVTNSQVGEPLSVYKTDGTWESFQFPGVDNTVVGDIVITGNDDKWIILPRGNDLFVRKSDGTDGRHLKLTTYFTNGTVEEINRMNDIYSIAKDHDGAIWIGASNGVAVFYNPEDIWDESTFYATPPALDLNDGIFHALLRTEKVTAIAVDGANRKWFGTSNSGVYLVSENGDEELLNFTVDNSPLLSNTIQSIAINPQSGEVFFGTPEGIISYRGEATGGADEYADVYAFPNPVREDYDGDIVITGLLADTDVRVTDISGNLVYKTTSLGGQAIWDGKNLNGNRVSTGVYVVFGNDKSGEKTFTTKILFIH